VRTHGVVVPVNPKKSPILTAYHAEFKPACSNNQWLQLPLQLCGLDDSELSPATFFFVPLLKSVSYQPPPFKRKPAAEIFLIKSGLLHAGQLTKGWSLIFCKASCSCPQDWH
jgi:hypothetical protein